ncbi:MAG: hypothetical protein P6D50_02060 [Acidimicrobiales bacterium]|nr:hypothetical protein [Acidimicrobiales bacterium]
MIADRLLRSVIADRLLRSVIADRLLRSVIADRLLRSVIADRRPVATAATANRAPAEGVDVDDEGAAVVAVAGASRATTRAGRAGVIVPWRRLPMMDR